MKYKMDASAYHRCALLHMIGQLEDMEVYEVSTATIAKIMGVSKPTAIARLDAMSQDGAILKKTHNHRSNAVAYKWSLSNNSRKRYENNHYKPYYQMFLDDRFRG